MKFLVFLLIAKISLSFGLGFHCKFQFSENYALIGSVYQCKTSNLFFGLSDPVLYKISGNPTTGFSHRDVKLVDIENAEILTYIPQEMTNPGLFPSLIALKMSNTGLMHLSGAQLNDYRNLMWISLSNNRIVEVPDDFFSSTPNLRYIDFNSNSISVFGFDTLTPINQDTIAYIGFKNNTCIDREYTPLDGNFYNFLYDLQIDCQEVYTTVMSIPTTVPTLPPTNPPTEPQTNPPTYPPTNPPTYPPTNPPTYPPTEPPTNPPTYPPTNPPTYPPTNPPTYPPTEPPTNPTTVITTAPTPSTTAAPTCEDVEIGKEVCKLNYEIRNLANVIEKRDQVFQKYEDVLLYVQETLKNINILLNKKL